MRVLGRKSIASVVKVVIDSVWWLSAVSLGLLVVLLTFSFFVEWQGNNLTMNLPVAVKASSSAHTMSGSIRTDAGIETLRGNLRFPVRNGAFFSGGLTLVVMICGFGLWVLTQLRHVFRALRDGQPFTAANAMRIRRAGFGVIVGELARSAMVYFWSYYLSTHFVANGLQFAALVDVNAAAILSGFAILVIAEVFREGVRLQEDQSLTI